MNKQYRDCLGLLACCTVLFCACRGESGTTNAPSRPYDPWIIRSVLDGKTRMITLALHDDLWVAYDTEHCSMYKAWKGYVEYEGAVYTTRHGPQPVTVGDAYIENVFEDPWVVMEGTHELETRVRYAGHRKANEHAELIYDLYTPGADPIHVEEHVEALENESGQIGLQRRFRVSGAKEGQVVTLKVNVNSIASMLNVETNGILRIYEKENKVRGNIHLVEFEGQLDLVPNDITEFTTFFVRKPVIPNTVVSSEGAEISMPLGYRLISRSDCKTCHNRETVTIGPAYADIARRYELTDKNIKLLADKVIRGGSGAWGSTAMSAHGDLPPEDVDAMVRWILSLDDDSGTTAGKNRSESNAVLISTPSEIQEAALLPGALTTVHAYPPEIDRLMDEPGSSPMMAGVMSEFAKLGNSDFVGLLNDFGIYASGFFRFSEDGEYQLRLWSDDGSRLWIGDELVIDNDGLHGATFRERRIQVKKGYYPFRLQYFQGGGDRFLSLNFKGPGQSEFATVPPTMIYHQAADRAVLAGKILPMSVVRRIPGDRFMLDDVHPAYSIWQARPDDFLPKVGGMDFISDGRLAICTWDPTGAVYLIDNLYAEDPNAIEVKKIADGLAEPLGLKIVDDVIYVVQKQELTRLVDLDGDDIIDEYQNVSNRWLTSANFHEFTFGLEYEDGYFYANLATAIMPGGASANPQITNRGTVMKIHAASGEIEYLASGLRTPNGIGFGVDNELFVSDNQGDWLPSSKIVHVVPGAWYGSRSVDFEGTADLEETLPVVWLPQDEIGNSPSTPLLLEDGPYAGQLMHGEVTHGGIKRVFVEKINGNYQGAVFRFTQGLEAGVNRIAVAPDSSIYIGGIGNPGNWAQTGKLWYGLQRIKYNGTPVFEMLAVRAKSNGIEIEFTEALKQGDGWNPEDFEIMQWKYVPTADYGGPKVNEERLKIVSASVLEGGRKVFLETSGMKEGHVLYVHLLRHFVSKPGRQLWSTEAWYTLNSIPDEPGEVVRDVTYFQDNTLLPGEQEDGWRMLFDGKSFDGWKRYRRDDIGTSWIIEENCIKLDARLNDEGKYFVEDRGDLMTVDEFENFELNLEWKISNCGNSGIMFSVVESDKYSEAYYTGPEMQVLDNSCHPDARFSTHRAGDLYDLIGCRHETVLPAGEWNAVRLIKKNGKVEHWLNGVKVVEYEMYTDKWDDMIANSKFRDWPDFGKAAKGHIVLQDHGDAQVWYRNIKIREL